MRSCVCEGTDRDAAGLFSTAEQVPFVRPTRSATIFKVTWGFLLSPRFFFGAFNLAIAPPRERLLETVPYQRDQVPAFYLIASSPQNEEALEYRFSYRCRFRIPVVI